jgi:CheY-like chemotaxis protein
LPPGKYIKISIHDEGEAIPPADQTRLFDPYFVRDEKSGGLGLPIAYAIVKNHEGHISVASYPNDGTTVTVYLPALKEQSDDDTEHPENDTMPVAKGSGRILLMDDEEIIRKSGQKLLSSLGYTVSICSEGNEASTLYKQHFEQNEAFDVVLLDLTVPGGAGALEAVKSILAIDPNARCIILSGYTNDESLLNFRSLGFKGVIAKPYRIDELRNTIQSIIEDNT